MKAQNGIDTDQEMQTLLVIEKNYAANAKVIQTVNDMIDTLIRLGCMTRISVGDASLTNILARQGADLRARCSRASQEVTTGRHADLAQALRGDVSPLLAIDASLARLRGLSDDTQDAAFQTAAQQTALQRAVVRWPRGLPPRFWARATSNRRRRSTALAADARGRLESAVGLVEHAGRGSGDLFRVPRRTLCRLVRPMIF